MAEDRIENRTDVAERTRRVLIETALAAYEDAGLSGLCAEGRWEAAIDAMRTRNLTDFIDLSAERTS